MAPASGIGRHRADAPVRGTGALRTARQLTLFSGIAALALTAAPLLPSATAAKAARADVAPLTRYQVPFPCGQSWTGSTRASHSPSAKAVDFNRTDDLGAPTVAAAAGTVTTAQPADVGGYGRHVVIDHGNNESTLYAHLDRVTVSRGQRVDSATQIGTVGRSGRVTGPHLHFEEKKGRAVVSAWFNGRAFAYPSTVTSANCVDVPLSATTRSAVARPAVYQRGTTSKFVIRTSATATRTVALGSASDEPLVGDWNGDGTSDVGVRVAGTATFLLKTGANAPVRLSYGLATDQPIAGDWDGDGRWEIGVYRPAAGTFLLRLDTGQTLSVPLAGQGAVPVTGDFDGDGATDVGIHQPTTRTFTLRTVLNDRVTHTRHVLGALGDLPVTGDWNGDGITELGTWTPRTAAFTTYQGSFVPIQPPDGTHVRTRPVVPKATVTFGRKRR